MEELGVNNKQARHVFSENGKLLYIGCSAGRKTVSQNLAETFAKTYGVKVEAPNQIYEGIILYNEDAEEIQLSEKTVELENPKTAVKYEGEKGEEYLVDFNTYWTYTGEGLLLKRQLIEVWNLTRDEVYEADPFNSYELRNAEKDSGAVKLAENWRERNGEVKLYDVFLQGSKKELREIEGFKKVEGPANTSHFMEITTYEKPSKWEEYLLELVEDLDKLL